MSRLLDKLTSIRTIDLSLIVILIVMFCCTVTNTALTILVYNFTKAAMADNAKQTKVLDETRVDITSVVKTLNDEWKFHDKQMNLQIKSMRIPEINMALLSAQKEIINSISETQEKILANYELLKVQTGERQKMQESVLSNIRQLHDKVGSCMDCHHNRDKWNKRSD